MAYTNEPTVIYEPPSYLAEVWEDPYNVTTRQFVMDIEALIRACGPTSLSIIRDAAYSLPDGGDVSLAFKAVSVELSRWSPSAGFVSATPSKGTVTVGLPDEPVVSVRVAVMDREFSLRILTAEVICA